MSQLRVAMIFKRAFPPELGHMIDACPSQPRSRDAWKTLPVELIGSIAPRTGVPAPFPVHYSEYIGSVNYMACNTNGIRTDEEALNDASLDL